MMLSALQSVGWKYIPPSAVTAQIISDIDCSVKAARFDNWQNTAEGTRKVKAALRAVMWLKYGIKDEKIFSRAYEYIEEYY